MFWIFSGLVGAFAATRGMMWRSLNQKPAPKAPPRLPPRVSPEREHELLALVCPEVRAVLQDELNRGNYITHGVVSDQWIWPDTTVIFLGFIFQSEPEPLSPSLRFECYNYKIAMGDCISCAEHHIVVIAAMPSHEQHLAPDVLVEHKRKERLQLSDG